LNTSFCQAGPRAARELYFYAITSPWQQPNDSPSFGAACSHSHDGSQHAAASSGQEALQQHLGSAGLPQQQQGHACADRSTGADLDDIQQQLAALAPWVPRSGERHDLLPPSPLQHICISRGTPAAEAHGWIDWEHCCCSSRACWLACRSLRSLLPHPTYLAPGLLSAVGLQVHGGHPYLGLQDVTAGFVAPCIMDIKVRRRQTYTGHLPVGAGICCNATCMWGLPGWLGATRVHRWESVLCLAARDQTLDPPCAWRRVGGVQLRAHGRTLT
jgi:hypothetical protein